MAYHPDLEMASFHVSEAMSLRRQARSHFRLRRTPYSDASYKALWHLAKWNLSLARIRMDMYKAAKGKSDES